PLFFQGDGERVLTHLTGVSDDVPCGHHEWAVQSCLHTTMLPAMPEHGAVLVENQRPRAPVSRNAATARGTNGVISPPSPATWRTRELETIAWEGSGSRNTVSISARCRFTIAIGDS